MKVQVTKDMAVDHLSKEQKNIANTILAAIASFESSNFTHQPEPISGGGCKAFYTPDEWVDRGERYGTESALIICHDGGDLARYFSYDYCIYECIEEMNSALEKIGYFAEQCTGWYSAIYPID